MLFRSTNPNIPKIYAFIRQAQESYTPTTPRVGVEAVSEALGENVRMECVRLYREGNLGKDPTNGSYIVLDSSPMPEDYLYDALKSSGRTTFQTWDVSNLISAYGHPDYSIEYKRRYTSSLQVLSRLGYLNSPRRGYWEIPNLNQSTTTSAPLDLNDLNQSTTTSAPLDLNDLVALAKVAIEELNSASDATERATKVLNSAKQAEEQARQKADEAVFQLRQALSDMGIPTRALIGQLG